MHCKHILAIITMAIMALAQFAAAHCQAATTQPQAIYLTSSPSAVAQLAANEVQKYVYLRTGKLLPVRQGSQHNAKPGIWLACDSTQLSAEEFKLTQDTGGLHITGGSDVAMLYGAYQYAELLGVMFTLHGDIVPDEPFTGSLMQCGKGNYSPLFEHRGLLPFHDFPEGPDLWSEDMYKSCITQMVKMKMNFFSLHTYPAIEPNVWVGLAEDVDPEGNVTYAYPTSLACTGRSSSWGYSAMSTRHYCCGASQLFTDSIYASPILNSLTHWPKNQEEMNLIFNRTGMLFDHAFSLGHNLGMKFCLGLETPLTIPKEVSQRLIQKGFTPGSDEAKAALYKGIFTRLQRRHPTDYFWLWTPEGWTWGTTSQESVDATLNDVKTARNALQEMGNPFGFGLSGWMLGPADNTRLFDKHLPQPDFLSSLSRLVGQERIDQGYSQLAGHRKLIPLLWLEDDPALTTPQFWVGRLRSDIAESYSAGCRGIVGNFWRTRAIDPNVIAMAQACWDQHEWNPYFDQKITYQPAPINDLRIGGVGTNYYRHIKGTEDQYLYNTQRYELRGYKVKVPNGRYRIRFMMSETRYDKAGERVFGIRIQDSTTINDIDIFRQVGRDTCYVITSDEVEVNNYMLKIDFLPVNGPTCLSAFVIEGATADANQIKGTPYKRSINVGGGLYKDYEADLSETVGNKPAMPRDLSTASLYESYATASFGKEVAHQIAQIMETVDGTIGNEGYSGFKMPRPAGWITGPGVIQPNETPWQQEQLRYAFINELYALRPEVKGSGNLARYDYWLNTFACLRTMGELGCMRGQMDKLMRNATKQTVESEVLPLRIELARKWEELIGHLLQTVSTSGEVGTLINLESQTRKTYGFLTKYDSEIISITGKALPTECQLSQTYEQAPRLIVLNHRELLQQNEDYIMQLTVLGKKEGDKAPVLRYRKLGKGKFTAVEMQHQGGNCFTATLPRNMHGATIEYYVTFTQGSNQYIYPASAPGVCGTWTWLGE
ncbi:MAG: malectin domain-containing carbohydrate-binding protein [Muribaculaceae bacterium]